MANAGNEYFHKRYVQLGGDIERVTIPKTLRVNTLRIDERELIERLTTLGVTLKKIPYAKYGYTYTSKFSLGAISEYLLGYYYLQEAAAQLPVQVLDPKPGDTVLDMCAAPGGKTTQIAQWMDNNGLLVSYDLKPHRVTSLLVNTERCGAHATIFCADGSNATKLGLLFDKILLDAPCSGNYASEPSWFSKRTLDGIKRNVPHQRKLLTSAAQLLKPGGVLVYSTCSLEPEENEMNINWALQNLPLRLERIDLPIGDSGVVNVFGTELSKELSKCKRFWPHKTNTEGFFIAKLVKQ